MTTYFANTRPKQRELLHPGEVWSGNKTPPLSYFLSRQVGSESKEKSKTEQVQYTPFEMTNTAKSNKPLIPSVHKVLSPRLSCFLYEKPLGSMRAPLKNRCSESMKESLDWNSASFIKEIHFSRPSQFVEGCFHHP